VDVAGAGETSALALALRRRGLLNYGREEYAAAAADFTRVLHLSERLRGPDHPETALALLNLSAQFTAQGRLGEALPLAQRALAIDEKALGPDHLTVAMILGNVGAIHFELGRFDDARPFLERALAIEEEHGPELPGTAMALQNLAVLLERQGRLE